MKILERHEISVTGICPNCKSRLELEKGSKSPYVICAACGKSFDVEGWEGISKLY